MKTLNNEFDLIHETIHLLLKILWQILKAKCICKPHKVLDYFKSFIHFLQACNLDPLCNGINYHPLTNKMWSDTLLHEKTTPNWARIFGRLAAVAPRCAVLNKTSFCYYFLKSWSNFSSCYCHGLCIGQCLSNLRSC